MKIILTIIIVFMNYLQYNLNFTVKLFWLYFKIIIIIFFTLPKLKIYRNGSWGRFHLFTLHKM